jgi:ribosomal protein S18 acetylase RimI-like enzyme
VLQIRPFELRDQDAVVSLWHRCDLVTPGNDPIEDIRRKLRVRPDLFLVGTVDDVVVGSVMAGYEGHRGWINYLAVDPSRRGEGFGRRLMDEAERSLGNEGCAKINLQVRSTNAGVIAFYAHLGYERDEVVSLGKRLIDDAAGDA